MNDWRIGSSSLGRSPADIENGTDDKRCLLALRLHGSDGVGCVRGSDSCWAGSNRRWDLASRYPSGYISRMIIDTTDRDGVRVICSEPYWLAHISSKHQAMKGRQNEVGSVVSSPEAI